jgi:tetratricopeptide (TPR) repeat protein
MNIGSAAHKRMNLERQRKALRFLLVLSLLASPAILSSQQIPKAEQHYRAGLQLEKQEKFREAASEFSKAIGINPEFEDAYYQLGISSLRAGDQAGAVRAMMQLSQLEPGNNQVRMDLGQVLAASGYYNDALALYLRALQLAPQDAKIRFNIGVIHFKQREYPHAIEDLQQVLELDPTMNEARSLLAAIYDANGDMPEAIHQLQEAVKFSPSADLLVQLGTLYEKQGRFNDAERELKTALSKQPRLVQAETELGKVYRLSGRLPAAIAELSQALQNAPHDSGALLERGEAEYAASERAAARVDFEAYDQLEPELAEGKYFLGRMDLDEGDCGSAVAQLAKAVARDAKRVDAYYYLALAHFRLGHLPDAEEALRRCLQLNPSHREAAQLLDLILKKDWK